MNESIFAAVTLLIGFFFGFCAEGAEHERYLNQWHGDAERHNFVCY